MAFSSKDSWLSSYDSLVELGAKVGMKVRERDQQPSGTPQRAKLDSSIGRLLQEFGQKFQTLKGSLYRLSSNHSIPDHEYERRKSMVEELSLKYQQLQRAQDTSWESSKEPSTGATGRWGVEHGRGHSSWGVEPGRAPDPWGVEPGHGPGSAHRLNVDEIRAQQQQMIEDQDEGLEALSSALKRQQQIGMAIQEDVTEQNDLIDEIHEATDQAEHKVRTQTRRVEEVRRRDSCWCTCSLWMIIILLAVVILIIAAVPHKGKK